MPRVVRRMLVLLVVTLTLVCAGCVTTRDVASSGATGATSGQTASATGATGAGGAFAADAAGTVWLCRPGAAIDPCAANEAGTVETASGALVVQPAPASTGAAFDCFYVYPTVSTEPGLNADLTVQSTEVDAAVQQASRFSQVCRVWAPMYRQRTTGDLLRGLAGDPTAAAVAYASLLSAWKDYLANDNHGRPFVLLGHSQGSAMLIQLIRSQIDPVPALRRRLVSAIILGGNVQVPTGAEVGGTFQHIPACTSRSQTGCVIAYSSFLRPPPTDSYFGRPGQGVSLQSGQTATTGQQVLCTNPADFGSSGALLPYVATTASGPSVGQPSVSWVEYPGMYTATCENSGGATWLQVTYAGGAIDRRPRFRQVLGPRWGLHLVDFNVALGNLVQDVATEEAAYH
jgi:hypothetical protein